MMNYVLFSIIFFLTGCAGLFKDRVYHLDRTKESSFVAECEKPGKEGDLVKIDGISFYFQPTLGFAFMGPPFLPVIPMLYYGHVRSEVRLVLAPGWNADPKKWQIKVEGSNDWIMGEAGKSRLRDYIAFKTSPFPKSFELMYSGGTQGESFSARFNEYDSWRYRPVIGLDGEQTRGWLPGCAR